MERFNRCNGTGCLPKKTNTKTQIPPFLASCCACSKVVLSPFSSILFPLCAAVGANALESANVVGYQNTEMVNAYGYNFIAPTFKDVTSNTATYDLQNIKLVGADVGDGASDYIEVWDETGNMTDDAYFYVTEAQGYDHDGWVTEMLGDEYAENVTLTLGQGFYLYVGSGADVEVQYAGEVVKGNLTSEELPYGYNIVGNATPAPVNLQQIQLLGADVGDGASDYIEVWDETGNMTDTAYFYVTEAQGYDHDGWVTEMLGDEYVTGVIYTPGQAFFLYVGSGADVQVKLPAVLAE